MSELSKLVNEAEVDVKAELAKVRAKFQKLVALLKRHGIHFEEEADVSAKAAEEAAKSLV